MLKAKRSRVNRVSKLQMQMLDDRIVPAVLLVDDDGAQFPSAPYTKIQDAVNAASPGDTIKVARGNYTEQVTITKNGIKLLGASGNKSVVTAPAAMTGNKAVVLVNGATNVVIDGFKITGPSADVDFGVQVTGGGSATIRENRITLIRPATNSGNQTGIGVVVGGSGDAVGTAFIIDNDITDYDKGGIIVSNKGSKATIYDNKIIGSGENAIAAQNGIQVSNGADAIIADNSISKNIFTGEGAEGAAILTSDAGKVVIRSNKIFDNQTGILAEGAGSLIIVDNDVRDSLLDGIVLNEVSGAYVSGNRIRGSGRDGIQIVDSKNNIIVGNSSRNNAGNGITVEGTSTGNLIALNLFKNNGLFDAFDDTTGTGSAGTANFWYFNNIGKKNF